MNLVPLSSVAGRLRIPTRVLTQMSREGRFPTIYSIGRYRRVDSEAVDRWLAEHTEQALAEREKAAAEYVRTGRVTVQGLRCP